MANPSYYPPLYTKVLRKNFLSKSIDVTILILMCFLVSYRVLYMNGDGFVWIIALFCESFFCFVWLLVISIKWNPVEYIVHPERLEERVHELPPVDLFVTTADPVLEPPIITVNTVLSLLAVNYPANKVACYVSDDGCSPLTYFSLVEASKFAKIWVPFCKKYNVQVRAPFRYFLNPPVVPEAFDSDQFMEDWENMKVEYEKLSRQLEDAAGDSYPLDLDGDFAAFSNAEPQNHSTIVKVIWENKEGVGADGEVPHLIYVAREKRPKHPHHYKAGAMNVLVRMSGLMTNAPFILNVDCDMYANNAEVVRQAMCLFFGSERESDCAFVQSPQLFYDNVENEIIVIHEFIGYGIVGIQGPFYQGSGCFHKRKVIYGSSPDDIENDENLSLATTGKLLAKDKLSREFGNLREMVKSAAEALEGKSNPQNALTSSLKAARQVASCDYEHGTAWGKTIGWLYGSIAEDINLGLNIHSRGWRTLYNSPDPPAFLGCIPPGGPTAMGQQKRWATGLLEILFSKNSPVFGMLYRKLWFRQGLAYLWILVWGLRSIPELCYALLPAYCILSNSAFLPTGPVLYILIALFTIYNLYTLWEYRSLKLSARCWWNCQQFARIKSMCAWLFSIPEIMLKFMGFSETIFIVTKKTISSIENTNSSNQNIGKFVFDESPYFLPGTTVLLVNLAALASIPARLQRPAVFHGFESGLGEILCSVWVILSFWPFFGGLFERGKYRIPLSTICKSTILASWFVLLSKSNSSPLM